MFGRLAVWLPIQPICVLAVLLLLKSPKAYHTQDNCEWQGWLLSYKPHHGWIQPHISIRSDSLASESWVWFAGLTCHVHMLTRRRVRVVMGLTCAIFSSHANKSFFWFYVVKMLTDLARQLDRRDFKLRILHIHLAMLKSWAFSVGRSVT